MESSNELDFCWQLYASGKYNEALDRYNELVKQNQYLPDSLICLGYCYDALEQKNEAFKCYQEAVLVSPNNPNANSALAGAYYEQNILDEAIKYSQKAISLDETCVTALVNMANILDVQKQYDEAIIYYQKAIDINPEYADAYSNMASSLFSLEKYKDSLKIAEKAFSLNASDINAYINAGNALDALGDLEEAVSYYNQALALDNENMIVYNNLAGVYEKLEQFEKASECYFKILEKDPDDNANHLAFGYLLYSLVAKKQISKAQELAKKWHNLFPDNSVATHMSAAVAIGEIPKKASDDYIKKLFDAFAPDFDSSLKAIEYQAPKLISKAIFKINKKHKKAFKILDAGCGTGLCGKYLQEYAVQGGLVGIDLSSKMLEEAKAKEVYDELVETEIVSFLKQNHSKFDMIVSADVFTYFGDLEELFKSLSDALKTGGQLFFTITRRLKPYHKGYILNASGRYSHNFDYVAKMLSKAKLVLVNFEEEELRKEAGEAVMGFVISAVKE